MFGCKGVVNIVDDLIVFGCGVREYDENMINVLKRFEGVNLILNRVKCEFRLFKLIYFGYDLGKDGIFVSKEKVEVIMGVEVFKIIVEVRLFFGLV